MKLCKKIYIDLFEDVHRLVTLWKMGVGRKPGQVNKMEVSALCHWLSNKQSWLHFYCVVCVQFVTSIFPHYWDFVSLFFVHLFSTQFVRDQLLWVNNFTALGLDLIDKFKFCQGLTLVSSRRMTLRSLKRKNNLVPSHFCFNTATSLLFFSMSSPRTTAINNAHFSIFVLK